jgi:hypothetical protein
MQTETIRTNIDSIAQTCYAANRTYSITLGAPGGPNWENAPGPQRDSLKRRVATQLELLQGGDISTASAQAGANGEMSYGDPTKDAIFDAICKVLSTAPADANAASMAHEAAV